jgi:hypothetical protein
VLAIDCKRSALRPVMGTVGLVVGGVSVSLRGIAGWFVMMKGPLNNAPRSGCFSAAIPGKPSEVHIEVHEVGNPLDFGPPGRDLNGSVGFKYTSPPLRP